MFLSGFHQHSCLYWAFHLSESIDHRFSTPLKTVSLDSMIRVQQAAPASFASWSNTIRNASQLPFRDYTLAYDHGAGTGVLNGISKPADCISIISVGGLVVSWSVDIEPETVNKVA